MSSQPIQQDFVQVVLRKKLTPSEEKLLHGVNVRDEHKGKNTQSPHAMNLHKIENEKVSLPHADVSLGRQIQTARMAKNMTQSDLDKACNFPANTTKSYENSHAIINPVYVTKMQNVLGVKLTRPKPRKISEE